MCRDAMRERVHTPMEPLPSQPIPHSTRMHGVVRVQRESPHPNGTRARSTVHVQQRRARSQEAPNEMRTDWCARAFDTSTRLSRATHATRAVGKACVPRVRGCVRKRTLFSFPSTLTDNDFSGTPPLSRVASP
eukprot:665898-Prymnesium_polylepis.1